MTRSRFAEEPAWTVPGELHQRIRDVLLPAAADERERVILRQAATRRCFSDCTPEEQDVILAVDARLGPSPHA